MILNSFHIWPTAVLTIQIMLHVTSLVLTYLIAGSVHILTTFIQFPLPTPQPTPASGNHKPDLFLYEFVCLGSIIYLQHYAGSWCTTQWFSISRYFKMITTKICLLFELVSVSKSWTGKKLVARDYHVFKFEWAVCFLGRSVDANLQIPFYLILKQSQLYQKVEMVQRTPICPSVGVTKC